MKLLPLEVVDTILFEFYSIYYNIKIINKYYYNNVDNRITKFVFIPKMLHWKSEIKNIQKYFNTIMNIES